MPAARLPADEPERLRALRRSGWLQGPADLRLDAIVERAARLFEVPVAAVTLLDQSRQVFKASVGLGVPHVPREAAFCGHLLLEADALVVLDAAADCRFADNPLVLGQPGIRFYAGAVVFGLSRARLGALCVVDVKIRDAVAPALLASLRDMAEEVSAILGQPPDARPG